jgi:hypothetical protein
MPPQDQNFLHRWSRLKREVSVKPEATARTDVPVAPAELPALDGLSFESDFRVFMHAKVDEGIRRAALKKLFSDPRFNVIDGLDVYIDDYSKEDPIPPGMLAQLQHVRTTLFGAQNEQETPSGDPPLAEARTAGNADKTEPDHGTAAQDA